MLDRADCLADPAPDGVPAERHVLHRERDRRPAVRTEISHFGTSHVDVQVGAGRGAELRFVRHVNDDDPPCLHGCSLLFLERPGHVRAVRDDHAFFKVV